MANGNGTQAPVTITPDPPPVDYDALAKQHGGSPQIDFSKYAAGVDDEALARRRTAQSFSSA
jgi:hypothetical protein